MHVTWVASYPKSGNTWIRFLLSAYFFDELANWDAVDDVVLAYPRYYGQATSEGESNDVLWERLLAARKTQRVRPPGFPSDMFLKTHHLLSSEHPFVDRTQRAILVVRNPRDVATSAINYSHVIQKRIVQDEKVYLQRFIRHGGDPAWKRNGIGSWQEHATSWLNETRFPVLLVRYEDLHADVVCQFERIVEFVGAPVDRDRLVRATELAAFDNLRRLEIAASGETDSSRTQRDRFFMNRGKVSNCLGSIDKDLDLRFEEAFAEGIRQFGYAA